MPTEMPHTRISFTTADNADHSNTVLVVWHYGDRTRKQPRYTPYVVREKPAAPPEQTIAEVMDEMREGLF